MRMITEKEKRLAMRRFNRRMQDRAKRDRKIEKLQIKIGKLSEVRYL